MAVECWPSRHGCLPAQAKRLFWDVIWLGLSLVYFQLRVEF